MSATTSHGRHAGVDCGGGGAGAGRFACGGPGGVGGCGGPGFGVVAAPSVAGARGGHRRGRRGPWRGRRGRRGHGGRARRSGGHGGLRRRAGDRGGRRAGLRGIRRGITNGRAAFALAAAAAMPADPRGGGLGSDDGQQCRRQVAAVGRVRDARGGRRRRRDRARRGLGGVGSAVVARRRVGSRRRRLPRSQRSGRTSSASPRPRPRHRRRGGHRGHVEQLRVLAAQVQHGRDPFERSASHAEDADPSAPHGLVDPATVRERRVEAAGELDGGGVADRELHGGDGPDAAVRERGGRAREEVGRAARTRLARVQHDEARRRLGLVEEVGEARRASRSRRDRRVRRTPGRPRPSRRRRCRARRSAARATPAREASRARRSRSPRRATRARRAPSRGAAEGPPRGAPSRRRRRAPAARAARRSCRARASAARSTGRAERAVPARGGRAAPCGTGTRRPRRRRGSPTAGRRGPGAVRRSAICTLEPRSDATAMLVR